MKKIYTIALSLITLSLTAQETVTTTASNTELNSVQLDSTTAKIDKNFIKLNLTSLILGNYSFQYERVLTKRISVAISQRHMPVGSVPFKSSFLDDSKIDVKNSGSNIVNNVKIGNTSFTPEVRFYLGKTGYGRGFYIAPYYRYTKFKIENALVNFEVSDGVTERNEEVSFDGDIKSHSFGFYIGSQFPIGKKGLYLDWWIVGGHFGTSDGELNSSFKQALNNEELAYVQNNLPDLDIPVVDLEFDVTNDKAKLKIDGPWAGLRAGLLIGYRF